MVCYVEVSLYPILSPSNNLVRRQFELKAHDWHVVTQSDVLDWGLELDPNPIFNITVSSKGCLEIDIYTCQKVRFPPQIGWKGMKRKTLLPSALAGPTWQGLGNGCPTLNFLTLALILSFVPLMTEWFLQKTVKCNMYFYFLQKNQCILCLDFLFNTLSIRCSIISQINTWN